MLEDKFKITRYTDKVQKFIGDAKSKPEPWLHVVFQMQPVTNSWDEIEYYRVLYAIYVWDTRECVEQGGFEAPAKFPRFGNVADNMQPIKAVNGVRQSMLNTINYDLFGKKTNATKERKKPERYVIGSMQEYREIMDSEEYRHNKVLAMAVKDFERDIDNKYGKGRW